VYFLIIGGTRDEAFRVQHGVVNDSLEAADLMHRNELARASVPFVVVSVCAGIGTMPALSRRSRIHPGGRRAPVGH
jgi:hypothetical protein